MLKIAIIENEEYWMSQMLELLQKWSETKGQALNIEQFKSGKEVLARYSFGQESCDIAFVDIELGDMSGLEAMRKLRAAGFEGRIVVTTSHQSFAYIQESFSLSALQYYIKPLAFKHIEDALSHICDKDMFIKEYRGTIQAVPYKHIIYFEGARNYIKTVCIDNANFMKFRETLGEFSKTLPPSFVRSNRSFIVNSAHIVRIQDLRLYMRNGAVIPLNNAYVDNVLRAFHN